MIERLRGTLLEKDPDGAVVDVGGVGYRASTSAATTRALGMPGAECVLYTRMVVREDSILLFGFATGVERSAFDALTTVSKVGPKLALAVLSTLSPAEVAECVGRNDVLKLSSVPGLGKKTAERLVLELRGRDLAVFSGPAPAANGSSGDGSSGDSASAARSAAPGTYLEARDALVGLGYSVEEAGRALNEVPAQDSVQGYLKEALRNLGSRR